MFAGGSQLCGLSTPTDCVGTFQNLVAKPAASPARPTPVEGLLSLRMASFSVRS